jgi:hypothetical protein
MEAHDDREYLCSVRVSSSDAPRVAVFGAYGHTGRFIVRELAARGYGLILSG